MMEFLRYIYQDLIIVKGLLFISIILLILLSLFVIRKKQTKKQALLFVFLIFTVNIVSFSGIIIIKTDYENKFSEKFSNFKENTKCEFNNIFNIKETNQLNCKIPIYDGHLNINYEISIDDIIKNVITNEFSNDFRNHLSNYMSDLYLNDINSNINNEIIFNTLTTNIDDSILYELEINDLKNYKEEDIYQLILDNTTEITLESNINKTISGDKKTETVKKINDYFKKIEKTYIIHININDKYSFFEQSITNNK